MLLETIFASIGEIIGLILIGAIVYGLYKAVKEKLVTKKE
jgi:hypothetical protein